MKDISLTQLTQVIRIVVREELSTTMHNKVPSIVHSEIRKELQVFEVRFWKRLDADLNERFNEVLTVIGEEHEKLVAAIGGHTVELTDHGRRIKKLEKLST